MLGILATNNYTSVVNMSKYIFCSGCALHTKGKMAQCNLLNGHTKLAIVATHIFLYKGLYLGNWDNKTRP